MQVITEKMGVHKDWYEDAKKQTIDTLPAFLNKLTTEYSHDYGTICHAVAAAAIGAAWAIDHAPTGGITGFQAGAVMWKFIRHWNYSSNKTGLRIIDYDNFLYPQYHDKFQKTISLATWEAIQKEARRKLQKLPSHASGAVVEHLELICCGIVPFGYVVQNE